MTSRYRCAACGNRTRFDVLSTRRSRAYYHYDLGGACQVEEEDVISHVVESVTCRWCGSTSAIEILGEGEVSASAEAPAHRARADDESVGPRATPGTAVRERH